MWINLLTLFSLLVNIIAEMTAPGIDRTISDGVKSVGFKVVYGDEDLVVVNEVVSDVEKSNALKNKIKFDGEIAPLPAEDVKCLMSVDRYCTKSMGEMKGILIQAIKEDCAKCTKKQKDEAGKVIASMMAHDPVAWKLFLTRYDGLKKIQRILG